MTLAILAAVVALISLGGMAYATRRARRRHTPQLVAADLGKRVVAAARAFEASTPWQAASDPDAPATAAAIEAALITGDLRRALEVAEGAVAADPEAAAPRVWLAWVLCAQAQPSAALAQLAAAAGRKEIGGAHVQRPGDALREAEGTTHEETRSTALADADSTGDQLRAWTPLARYVRARAEHLAFEHASGAAGPVPPLVTTGDLAVVTLARGRGGPTWLTGGTEMQLSAEQVRAAVGGHRDVTARCLGRALDALDAAPGFADAAYLVARLAVKAGAVAPARAMFGVLPTRMDGRPDVHAFARDRADLDDPSSAVTAAKQKPVPAGAKRSTKLKVLP